MAVGIGEYDAAAGFGQLDGHIAADLILGDVGLENDLRIKVDAQLGAGSLQAVDVRGVITGILVVDADQADLHVRSGTFRCGSGGIRCAGLGGGGFVARRCAGSGGIGAAAGSQTQNQHTRHQQCNDLLHSVFLL